jgi:hypothetical protein
MYINYKTNFSEELDILQTYEFSFIILYFTNNLPFLTYICVLRKPQIIFILFHVSCYFAVYKYFCMTSKQSLNIFIEKQSWWFLKTKNLNIFTVQVRCIRYQSKYGKLNKNNFSGLVTCKLQVASEVQRRVDMPDIQWLTGSKEHTHLVKLSKMFTANH